MVDAYCVWNYCFSAIAVISLKMVMSCDTAVLSLLRLLSAAVYKKSFSVQPVFLVRSPLVYQNTAQW